MTTIEAGLSSAGFSIEEQMNCAAHALEFPLLVLDTLGNPIAATANFPPTCLPCCKETDRHCFNRNVLLSPCSPYIHFPKKTPPTDGLSFRLLPPIFPYTKKNISHIFCTI